MNRLSQYSPQALAVLRIVTALLFISHSLVKLAGFPPGAAPGQQPLMSLLGAAGLIEFVTGVLILLGLFTRQAALLASGEMAVAYWMVHAPKSPFPVLNGGESAVLFCFIFFYFVFAGPGPWSLDARLGRSSDDS
jgi:putative oxidoreductase